MRLTLLFLASCASSFAPTPYTAEQIRDATHEGRTYTFRTEAGATYSMRFKNVSKDGADIESGGHISRVTWEDLRKHALWPKEKVVISEDKVTVPAGTFQCVVYTVGKDRFYFAKDLPGAPIQFEKDGGKHQLVEHKSE